MICAGAGGAHARGHVRRGQKGARSDVSEKHALAGTWGKLPEHCIASAASAAGDESDLPRSMHAKGEVGPIRHA